MTDILTNPQESEDPYAYQAFEDMHIKAGLEVPQIMKALALAPIDTECGGDYIYMRNLGERLPFRGADWNLGYRAGVFALYLGNPRSFNGVNVGFRSAFIL